jgi:PAT family beta-lactamase induction signal transducer AmpG
MLAIYIAAMSIPTLQLAWAMQQAGWIHTVDPKALHRPIPPGSLVATFWIATLVYSAFNGLMYGTRSALFMDVTTPAVAATQFTAYMALLNLAIAYSARWQGIAIERWGYPTTLVIDSVVGLFSLVLLPWMVGVRQPARERPPGEAIPEAVQP